MQLKKGTTPASGLCLVGAASAAQAGIVGRTSRPT